jgi:hypothetical protein
MGIKEKFGTGWIGRGTTARGKADAADESASSEAAPSRSGSVGSGSRAAASDSVFLMLGKQMIRFLEDAGGVDRLDSLAEKMRLEAGDLQDCVEWLASNYYIRVIPEKFGNHEIRLTEKAKELGRAQAS